MRTEDLYETVNRVWNYKRNLPTSARAYLAYHQIICAMLDSKGGNDYLRESKSLNSRLFSNSNIDFLFLSSAFGRCKSPNLILEYTCSTIAFRKRIRVKSFLKY